MRVLLDTNIYISFLLNPASEGSADRLVTFALDGRFEAVLPEDLLDELLDVVQTRPRVHRRVDPTSANQLIEGLTALAVRIPRLGSAHPRLVRDPDDDYLLPAATVADAGYLVTGDKDLLDLRDVIDRPRILTAAEFLDLLEAPNLR